VDLGFNMTCFNPLTAWKSRDPDDWHNGKSRMVFQKEIGLPGTETKLPCGQCAGCRLARSREWAIRCMHEAKLHENNCFVTLTYNDENLSLVNGLPTLCKRNFVLFMKKLRKKYGNGIRFFQCGEYGEKLCRPHHHAIIFGHDFRDRLLFSRQFGVDLFTSVDLQKLWGHGFCTIGTVTFDSACYTSRYIMAKQLGKTADEYYNGREPEYITMSRRPGIGRRFYDKFKDDMYSYDKCVVLNNFVLKPPKYYDSLYDIDNHERLKALKKQRKESAPNLCPTLDRQRLDTLEKHLHLKMNRFKRDYQK
jgi:hypothetical protein